MPEEIKAQFVALHASLEAARCDAGHEPGKGRALSLAITNLETAELWADTAFRIPEPPPPPPPPEEPTGPETLDDVVGD